MFYENIPEVLYHYCSIPTFFSIVNSRSLWLCNGLNMNDKYDSRYFEIVASEWLQRTGGQAKDEDEKIFCEICYTTLLNYGIERPVPFIASFSDNGDLLGQWIAYANKGAGVCIGFQTSKLLEYSVDNPVSFLFPFNEVKNDDILLINVEYSKKEIENTIERLFKMFFEIYQKSKEKVNSLQEVSILFCGSIYRDSALYKHKGFQEEHEWRLISHCASHFSGSKHIKAGQSNIKFACINENIKSHITLDLRKNWNDGLIQSIVLGPRFLGNEYDFEFFVNQNFTNKIIIQKSKIPYRG